VNLKITNENLWTEAARTENVTEMWQHICILWTKLQTECNRAK